MPLLKKCIICGNVFKTKLFFVKNGGGKYCSVTCHHKGLKTGKFLKCDICQKDTYKTLKALKQSKSGKWFCSKSCQTKWRNSEFVGMKHANYTSGKASYRSVLPRNKVPPVCRLCKTRDARVLAVHHIDENRLNNELKNLVWLCHNCHHLVHQYEHEREKLMVTIV